MSIKLSKNYGVNPSMNLCFFCKEVKEIVLFGKLPGDAIAPKEGILNYDPCDKCKKVFEQGFTLIEASITPMYEGQKPLEVKNKTIYPTGAFFVITLEAARECLGRSEQELNTNRIIFVNRKSLITLGLIEE